MKVIHTVLPGGCTVIAASEVEEITDLEWPELGMPEAFWVCKVKEFGPLIVSIYWFSFWSAFAFF